MTADTGTIRNLIYLNGLSAAQVAAMETDAFRTPGWVHLSDGGGLPLVSQVTAPEEPITGADVAAARTPIARQPYAQAQMSS